MRAGASALRDQLRQLIDEHVPPDFLGAFTDDPADLEIAQRFLPRAGRPGSALPGLAARVRRPRRLRRGNRPWSARRCGPTTSPAAPSTWGSTGSARRSCGTARRSSGSTHLPAIARGEVIWCQGFSEPDAGSDLASLRTAGAGATATDGWRLTARRSGLPTRTMAQWCFLLARTARATKKQQGLTVFLVPMSAPASRCGRSGP